MSVSETKRKRIFEIIQIGNKEDLPSRAFDIGIVIAIVLNIAVLFLDTFDGLSAYDGVFRTVEIVTILIFCVEYALRIWTADLLYPEEKKKSRAILKFIFSFDGLVDLLTILPFFFLSGMGAVRFLRVARIFHLFRINTQYESFQVITSVLKEKRNAILYSVFIIVVLILAASLTMYSVEHTAQPEAFQNAFSGIWWSVSTVFTVGVGAVAIPTGILSAGFVEHYSRMQRSVEAAEYKNSSAVILADKASPYAGRRVKEIEEMNAVCVTALIRGELVIVPEDTVRIEEGDVLLVTKL